MSFLFRFLQVFNSPEYLLLNAGIYLFLSFFLAYLRAVAGEHVPAFLSLVVLVLLMRTVFEIRLRAKEIAELRSLGTPLPVFPLMKIFEKVLYALVAAGLLLLWGKFSSLPPDWLRSVVIVAVVDSMLVLLIFTPASLLLRSDRTD
jgi:hypothetical protein